MTPEVDQSATMILKLWFEPAHETALRARLTHIIQRSPTEHGEQAIAAATSADEICAVVKRWVEDFLESMKQGAP